LGVAGGSPADHIVDFDVLVVLAASIQGIGEFDEDGVLLHDALNVLASNSDDALVVLIGDVEGDGSGHLLLNKIETILRSFVLAANNINVEVVFIEAVEDDLNIA
jgi:hypothetical protein